MRQYLLPATGTFFKANLHCHSTMSDGKLTPEEMKAAYQAAGYQILCISDHEYLLDHSDLTTDDFLMITGYELYIKSSRDRNERNTHKTAHLHLISRDPHNEKMICVDPDYMGWAAKHVDVTTLPRVGDICHRHYSPRCINCVIRQAHENGFFVFYNHPSWSMEGKEVYLQYQGLDGVEVYNSAGELTGFPWDDSRAYDDFLKTDQRMIAVAGDDNHNLNIGAHCMIKAEKLDYDSVIDAIEKGNLYATCGPEIHELFYEDGTVTIRCSDASAIYLITAGRSYGRNGPPFKIAEKGGSVTEASFCLKDDDSYFRIEVVDHEGNRAYTKGYFLDDLNK